MAAPEEHPAWDEEQDYESMTEAEYEAELLKDGYELAPVVEASRSLPVLESRLLIAVDGRPEVFDAARTRAASELHEAMADLLTPGAVARRNPNGAAGRFDVSELMELCVLLDECQIEATRTTFWAGDYAEHAASDVLLNATTTTQAITLLLEHGFVLDAEARWRGLHELTCTAALIAADPDPAEASARYLAHSGRLLVDDPAYLSDAATDPGFQEKNYEWLRASHPHLSTKSKPIPFTQRWLFDEAGLKCAPFSDWIQPSHSPVHMTSAAVARGRVFSGHGDPAGYNDQDARQVTFQVACSLYELVSAVGPMLISSLPAEKALAWADEFGRRAKQLRPGPRLST